ncbi:lipoprotein signal peptidase [Flavobacterium agricola]|uniref:Lipoprotein signal peptidase n=1 Tax=Flavobacterium agricola TaxID=2870839 RepID=A0ABY6LYL1_9FLAO|nr:lipoprotein signal peptidase [Flavobacterium agricola]UYW01082.1 lipoprotein signal peptidase [Flavobacterium agricola]
MSLKKAYILVFIIIIIDQVSKFYIKTHFKLGEFVEVFPWFQIYFIENEGMAWGMKLPGNYGKIALTSFRILAIFGIMYWLWDSVKNKANTILIVAVSLILAGAAGNIIDCVFYGRIFDTSAYGTVAQAFTGQGYGPWLEGKVVDMFYFPILKNSAGETIFFNAIFNVADAAISVGVILLIIFNKKIFKS